MSFVPSYLPIEPLLLLCAARHHTNAEEITVEQLAVMCRVDTRTIARWKADRRVPVIAADRVAIGLGLHPALVWGACWFEGET